MQNRTDLTLYRESEFFTVREICNLFAGREPHTYPDEGLEGQGRYKWLEKELKLAFYDPAYPPAEAHDEVYMPQPAREPLEFFKIAKADLLQWGESIRGNKTAALFMDWLNGDDSQSEQSMEQEQKPAKHQAIMESEPAERVKDEPRARLVCQDCKVGWHVELFGVMKNMNPVPDRNAPIYSAIKAQINKDSVFTEINRSTGKAKWCTSDGEEKSISPSVMSRKVGSLRKQLKKPAA